MKFLLLLCLATANAQAVSIISDLDETIKITGGGSAEGIFNSMFTTKTYSQMDTLYRELREEDDKLYILTASLSPAKLNIKRLLRRHDFNQNDLFVKPLGSKRPNHDYKFGKIVDVLNASAEPFILIGDNQGKDQIVYGEVVKEHSDRIAAIYVRNARGHAMEENIRPYFTALDIALQEYQDGRLSRKGLIEVYHGLYLEKNLNRVFSKFIYCPTSVEEFPSSGDSVWKMHFQALNQKFVDFCSQRKEN